MPKFYYKVIIPNTDIWYLTLVIFYNIWLYYKLNTFKNICIVIIQGAVLFTLLPSFLFYSELGNKFVRPQHLIFKYHELLCMDLWQVMAQLSKDLIMKYQTDIMVVLKKVLLHESGWFEYWTSLLKLNGIHCFHMLQEVSF